MGTTENFVRGFHAMADDFAATMTALRREDLDRALEAVKDMLLPLGQDLEGFIVVVPAQLTFRHNFLL